jgi:thiol-disulfide isomerase/thioredoxin
MKKEALFPYVKIFLFAGAVIFLYIFWEWGGASSLLDSMHPSAAVESHHVGTPAPELEIPAARMGNRQNFRLSALRGYPIVLHFWATWCGPCLQELPELLKLSERIRPQGFTVVAVAVDENWRKLDEFFAQHPELAKMRQLTVLALDPEGETAGKFGSSRFPETFLINDDLVIDNKFVGPQPWNDAAVEPYLARLRTAGKRKGIH